MNKSEMDKLGLFTGISAALAFVACNGLFVLVAIFSLFGIAIVINPHIQAAAISLFALSTLAFVFMGYRHHRVVGPLAMAFFGATIIIGSMYIYFNKIIESTGLLVLIISAIWNWRTCQNCEQH